MSWFSCTKAFGCGSFNVIGEKFSPCFYECFFFFVWIEWRIGAPSLPNLHYWYKFWSRNILASLYSAPCDNSHCRLVISLFYWDLQHIGFLRTLFFPLSNQMRAFFYNMVLSFTIVTINSRRNWAIPRQMSLLAAIVASDWASPLATKSSSPLTSISSISSSWIRELRRNSL